MYKSLLALPLVLLAACSSVGDAVNPYKSNFNCPYKELGRCMSMTDAYQESRHTPPPSQGGKTLLMTTPRSEIAYQEGVYKRLTTLLDEPKTPMIAPPKVMRVLLLPYRNEKDLYMYRYAYFVVGDFQWVLDGTMTGEGR
jgi:conjugal transfer pilus assembly protein TraV